MEAPLHQSPVPLPPAPAQGAALLQQAAAARALMGAAEKPPGMGRERCPRCASRDTKFCYYNNYNTAQPRHFCRACRRYWTLGGSLRNVPVGGSTRKRPRPARPTRAIAAAANATPAATASVGALFASSAPAGVAVAPSPQPTMQGAAGGLLGSLLLGPASSSPGLLGFGFGLGLGQPALGDSAGQQLGLGAGPLLWPATTILEGNRTEEAAPTTWKAGGVLPLPPAAALWQELAAAAPVDASGLLPHLLM